MVVFPEEIGSEITFLRLLAKSNSQLENQKSNTAYLGPGSWPFSFHVFLSLLALSWGEKEISIRQ